MYEITVRILSPLSLDDDNDGELFTAIVEQIELHLSQNIVDLGLCPPDEGGFEVISISEKTL